MTVPVFVHICLVARDLKELSRFYMEVFGLVPVPPERHLKGEWFEKATGIRKASAEGIHLMMRGEVGPNVTLEVLKFDPEGTDVEKVVNRPGLSHMAFRVDDVKVSLKKVLDNGGTQLGEIVSKEIKGAGNVTFVYVRDPEGNILELQRWDG
jgi:catechol 2,3-dioxygenase-like lactoylglutathione lyase family enzyme